MELFSRNWWRYNDYLRVLIRGIKEWLTWTDTGRRVREREKDWGEKERIMLKDR